MQEVLWTEIYRPRTIDDCILPEAIKKQFRGFVASGVLPNMILTGKPGVGKTTVAYALLDEMGIDYYKVNASLNNSIDQLRNDILQFASTKSLYGGAGRKFVVLDEADRLSAQAQDALRGFIEEFSANCGFILTCNVPSRLTDAIKSRMAVIEFLIPNDPELQLSFFKRVSGILKEQNIAFEKPVLAEFIKKFFPDFRKTLNELQRYSHSGAIDTGILARASADNIKDLLMMVKGQDLTSIIQWIADNPQFDPIETMMAIYEKRADFFPTSQYILLIHLINEYQKSHFMVANTNINLIAFLCQLMTLEWR